MKELPLNKPPKIGIIILAAGASRRMGTPKQLLKIGQQTLIEHTIDIAQRTKNSKTVVVLGANAKKITVIIEKRKKAKIIINKNWQEGMGTTLRVGVQFLLEKTPKLEAIIVLVCDQPYLTTNILLDLITAYQKTLAGIVVTQYQEIKGVPALFSKELFSKLLQLNKDEGARKIIKKYQGKIATIDFPKGGIDLDTPESYQWFLENQKDK